MDKKDLYPVSLMNNYRMGATKELCLMQVSLSELGLTEKWGFFTRLTKAVFTIQKLTGWPPVLYRGINARLIQIYGIDLGRAE